jgi:beta-glucosidase
MIGTNNIGGKPNTGDDPAGVAEGIKKIVQLVRDKTGAKVLLLAVFPRGDTEENTHVQREKLREINRTIAKLDDGKNVRYLDLWDKFTDKDGNIATEIMRDHLHPTAAGYQIWAESMDPLLKEMMGG